MTHDRCLHLRATIMVSGHALVTMHATARVPADADALPDFQSFGIRTQRRDPTDDLVAENRGILRKSPFIVQERDFRMTQSAMLNCDFNVFVAERPEINGFEYQPLFYPIGNPCFATCCAFDSGSGDSRQVQPVILSLCCPVSN